MSLSVAQIRRRYLTLLAFRWFAVGLVIPVQFLLALSRGLDLADVGMVFAVQGFVVLVLELPTGALTDAWGRRPVLLLATVVGLVASAAFYVADTVLQFGVAMALMGVFRALDSGPLEAWYVDATHEVDPGRSLERGLAAGGAVLGLAIALGSVISGALVAWNPFSQLTRLSVPLLAGLLVQVVLLIATAALMVERRHADSGGVITAILRVPRLLRGGLSLVTGSGVLVGLVLVEFLWGFGMPAFESLTPVRLAELLGNADEAAAWMGAVGSAAWAVSALGAAGAPLLTRHFGLARSAALLRVVQGGAVVGMGLATGPVGLVAWFLACYVVHGCSNPLHSALLHRQVGPEQRATVVSINSMFGQGAGALGTLVLTALASGASVSAALVVAGAILALAAPLYLPAWRRERGAAPTGAAT